VLFKII